MNGGTYSPAGVLIKIPRRLLLAIVVVTLKIEVFKK